MNKKSNSKKVSLLERAINQQKELTEQMIGLTQEVAKANEIRELKSWKRSANWNEAMLRRDIDIYKQRLESAESREKHLTEKISLIKAKVEKKARLKQPNMRRVDARNILAIIIVS